MAGVGGVGGMAGAWQVHGGAGMGGHGRHGRCIKFECVPFASMEDVKSVASAGMRDRSSCAKAKRGSISSRLKFRTRHRSRVQAHICVYIGPPSAMIQDRLLRNSPGRFEDNSRKVSGRFDELHITVRRHERSFCLTSNCS